MPPKLTFYALLLAPIALLAYHFGPGQTHLQRDDAARQIAAAREAEAREDWPAATQAYAAAMAKVPTSDARLLYQLRLAHSKARMYSGEIIEAIGEMKGLLSEIPADEPFSALRDEVQSTLGSAEYYAGWLMRLEGAPTAEWTAEVENARQYFRLLSEDRLQTPGSDAAKPYQENLESTIRLARMDLNELKGMPLPKFCSGCKNVSQKCRGQCESKKPQEKVRDARKSGASERPRGGS